MAVKRFIQPKTYEELGAALSCMDPDSKVIAGGTDLVIKVKNNDPEIPVLVSLCKTPELKGIWVSDDEEGQTLHIGAMNTHAEIAESELVRKHAAALAESCGSVGSQQIRNRGTAGGNLGNASVAGDVLPVLYLLHADLLITGPDCSERIISAEELAERPGKTTLSYNEIVKEMLIPVRPERHSLFVKMGAREEVTIAEISLCLSWECEEGKIANVEGILGAVDSKPVWLTEADSLLGKGSISNEDLDELSDSLAERIRVVRMNRKRPPRLRIREGEREYKERAVKGVVYDAAEKLMRQNNT